MARKPSRPPHTYERGILCLLIGAAVLLAPRFLGNSGLAATIAGASAVGWFALVMGVALIAVDLVQRARSRNK
ncbi:MAG: hypothetical protein EOP81_14430 [Variovorax sp.]|nr:MAG: hypothetical protein EOP81_14430 [Variovorax sp.]